MLKFAAPLALVMTSVPATAFSQNRPSVFLEELTWTEVREAIESGTTTIIIPTAGTEQNGPHMVLGKHRFIINAASERIANELGDTLVAPVVTYVPEGDVENPRGHMTKAGTITLPNEFSRSCSSTPRGAWRCMALRTSCSSGTAGGISAAWRT